MTCMRVIMYDLMMQCHFVLWVMLLLVSLAVIFVRTNALFLRCYIKIYDSGVKCRVIFLSVACIPFVHHV